MAKAVFLHKADSIYDDVPESRYDFPRQYLRVARSAVGDWVIYYEPVKAGGRGYFAVARVADVVENPAVAGRYLARVAPGTYLPFDAPVARILDGRPLESLLAGADGLPLRGGITQSAVRALPEADFNRIVSLGLPIDLAAREEQRYQQTSSFEAPVIAFDRPAVERLVSRPYRDILFRRLVRDAYGERCAISGLGLRNGGGRPEVQAAHIVPVEAGGPDKVSNGIALTGTLHWMFDRGLISVAGPEGGHRILISHNKVDRDTAARLIRGDACLRLPQDPRNHPHPEYLRWHRENRFGLVH